MSLAPAKVLVLDEREDTRELLELVLAQAGFDVLSASTGADALALLEKHDVDVGVIDLAIPAMDGVELARRLRAFPASKAMCIVVVSGHADAVTKRRAHEAGIDLYMVKPVHPPELVANVRACLARRLGSSAA